MFICVAPQTFQRARFYDLQKYCIITAFRANYDGERPGDSGAGARAELSATELHPSLGHQVTH